MKNQFEDLTRRVIRSSIDWSGAGLRLDDYLAARFTYRSLEEWRDRIVRGEIMVNDGAAAPEQLLALHDKLEYFPGDLPEPEADLSFRVAYEDEELLIIDKPGNLCVHPSGPFFRHTLWHLLCTQYGKIHLVNRLDRETSGLLIAAKNPQAAAKLGKPSWPVRKEYLALVFGSFSECMEAYGFLMQDTQSAVRKKRRFVPGERPPAGALRVESAGTRLLPELCGAEASLVRAVPETGRLHQIRATLYSLGFPLLGDKLYGPDDSIYLKIRSGAITAEDREKLILPRQALHSALLEVRHPVTNELIRVESPLPAELSACIPEKIGLY
ncbi:MAG: RluA family pseudouridine synthase [Lentisphaeria bacterium]|nr:RluA family pseudouridine synthase [Lentisphaeria bacterium]